MESTLTISQLAAYAGVTVRAVRHYHARGLLPEPERDASGYRRYDAEAVVRLIRIRTLAEAGVPLARVQELLGADPDEFTRAVGEIDRRLEEKIRELTARRERVVRLGAGDSLALPAETVKYLERLRDLGAPERMLEIERDAWILIAAQAPELMGAVMADKQAQLDDPVLVQLILDMADVLGSEELDEARLESIADRLHESLLAYDRDDENDMAETGREVLADQALVDLLDSLILDATPAVRRLIALMEERGWSGWTGMTRTES